MKIALNKLVQQYAYSDSSTLHGARRQKLRCGMLRLLPSSRQHHNLSTYEIRHYQVLHSSSGRRCHRPQINNPTKEQLQCQIPMH